MSPIYVGTNSVSGIASDRIGFPTASSNVSTPAQGDMYFDTSDSKLKLYDGTEWVDCN